MARAAAPAVRLDPDGRRAVRRRAKEAHDAGRVRATEVRAGQFLGAWAYSVFTLLVQPKVLAGFTALVPAALDVPHTYSAIGDTARALAAVPEPRLDTMTDRELTLLGLGDPFWDEMWETYHMSHRPFTVGSAPMETTFGVAASPLDDVLKEALTRT